MNENGSARLLLVDDNPDNLISLEALIRGFFPLCDIFTAAAAEDGMSAALEQDIDIALVDVRMPLVDGVEMCRRLKAHPKTCSIPVILMTAYKASTELKIQGLDSGADDFISKPVDPAELVSRIKVMIRIKTAEDELRRERDLLKKHMKKRTRQFKSAETRYHALFDGVSDAIFIHDFEGRFLKVNEEACRRLEYSHDELVGMTLQDIDNREFGERIPERMDRIAGGNGPLIFETVHISKNGREIPTEFNVRKIDYKGSSAVLSVARDITIRKKSEEYVRSLTRELIKAQETVRRRIAFDLHDNAAQDLSALKLKCRMLFDSLESESPAIRKTVLEIIDGIDKVISEVRNLAHEMRPVDTQRTGLIESVLNDCDECMEKTGIKAHFDYSGIESLNLDFDVRVNLYYVIHEALKNIMKHSGADNAAIRLERSGSSIVLRIDDDGRGFDIDKRIREAEKEKRMGLRTMEGRIRLLGGRFEITSGDSGGVSLFAEVPLKQS